METPTERWEEAEEERDPIFLQLTRRLKRPSVANLALLEPLSSITEERQRMKADEGFLASPSSKGAAM